MPTELLVLTLCALLQVLQFCLVSVRANREIGPAKTLGPRDEPDVMAGLSLRTGRLFRALNNHFEALILFTIAVVVITLSDQSSVVTRGAAWVFLVARILYVPAYAFGLVPWRSVIWSLGFGATVILLIAALL